MSALCTPKCPAEMPERRFNTLIKLQRKFAILAVPAVLALAAVSYGSVVAAAAPVPSPAATSATEPAESTAPEAVEANEPALPGGGFADTDNVQANTQQEGVN
jgi:hypothetical protein